MEVVIRYFPGCPSRRLAEARVRQALEDLGLRDARIVLERVDTADQAQRLGFRGSPTILVDGGEPFAEGLPAAGLACRLFSTPDGPQGAPTVDQLRAVFAR